MHKKFELINKEYDEFYKSLAEEGGGVFVLDTSHGIWGTMSAKSVFDFFQKVGLGKFKSFLDLGSGDGKIALIASLFTNATGIEGDKGLFNTSIKMRSKLVLDCELVHGDYLEHDLGKYDVIFCNPDKPFYHGLETKLIKEFKGVLFVYNDIFLPRFLKKKKVYRIEQMTINEYRVNCA